MRIDDMIESVRRAGRRLRLLLRRGTAERAMDEELRHHIDCETTERMRDGLSYDVARQQALEAFGNVEVVKELGRDARGIRALEDVAVDVRYAWRHLVRRPGFAIAAIGTIALGAGAVAAIYSLVYGVLLRPLPYLPEVRPFEPLVIVAAAMLPAMCLLGAAGLVGRRCGRYDPAMLLRVE